MAEKLEHNCIRLVFPSDTLKSIDNISDRTCKNWREVTLQKLLRDFAEKHSVGFHDLKPPLKTTFPNDPTPKEVYRYLHGIGIWSPAERIPSSWMSQLIRVTGERSINKLVKKIIREAVEQTLVP